MTVIKLKQAMSLLRINKFRYAFTLIESLITLTIVCIVLLLPTIDYRQQLELQQEKLALLAFQSNWHNWINDSFLYHEVRIISVNQQTHCLKFIDPNDPPRSYEQHLPRQLDCRLSRNFIRIKSGEVTPQTIIFVSAATNQEYRFKVQMQWGELIEEKT